MADKPEPPENAASADHRATTPNHREARAAALQKALRDNLRRRKQALANAIAGVADPTNTEPDA